jgi:AraC-like DNA-binding protein
MPRDPNQNADDEAYHEAFRDAFAGVRQSDWGGEPSSCTFKTAALGALRVSRLSAPSHVATWAGGRKGSDGLKILLQLRGQTCFTQGETTYALPPGGWLLCPRDRAYAVINRTAVDQVLVEAPLDLVARRAIGRLNAPLVHAEPHGAARVLGTLLSTLAEEIDALDAAASARFADTVADLIAALALSEVRRHAADILPADLLRERAQLFIKAHLTDPDLSVKAVARAMNCSERYVYKAFETHDVTPDRYIWDARLARCGEMLADPAWAGCSISEVAYRHGFASSAHFSRAFRTRFGMSPSEARRTALA